MPTETWYFYCMTLSSDTMSFCPDTAAASPQTHCCCLPLSLSSCFPCDHTNSGLDKQEEGKKKPTKQTPHQLKPLTNFTHKNQRWFATLHSLIWWELIDLSCLCLSYESHKALECYLQSQKALCWHWREPLIKSSGNTSYVLLKCNFRPGSTKTTSLFCASPWVH